jgi:hypothetical protein
MFAASKTDGSAVAPDAQFNYVTMLLHGDGTNGAQNNTFVDSSTNNFTITRNGNTTQGSFSPYGSNWSNYLPNSGSVQYSGVSTALQFTGDFTIEGWYNLANFNNAPAGGNPGLIGNGTPNWLLVITGGEYNFYASGSLILASSSASPSANVWNHFALVRSGSTLKIYHNGVSVGSTTNSATLSIGSNVTVGSNGTGGIGSILGYISNVRVVKGTAVYTANFTPPTTPLTAISGTQLLTAQANRFIDSSSNNFSATIETGPSVQRFNPFGTSTAYSTSVIGGSAYLDSSGDYFGCGTQTAYAMGTGDFTMEAWLNFPSASSYRQIFSTRPNSGSSSANGSLGVNPSNGITWYTSGFIVDYTTNIGTNQWIHVAVSRSGTTLRVFINGAIVGTATNSDNLTGSTLTIGANGDGSETFNGYISNARVVKGTAVYTSAFTPPTAPLTAITNTSLLCNMVNGAIFDNAMMNDLETVGNAQISTSVKKYGTGSIYFDGNLDGLFTQSTPNLAFGTGDFTVEFWLYLAANLNTFAKVVMMGTTGNCFTIEAQGTANVLNLTNLTSTVYVTSSTALTTGTWIHVAATRASGTLRLFQNGTQVGSAANTVDFPNTGGIYIGRSNTGQETNGYIDDLRITKGFARYTTTFTPPTAALSDTGPI